MLDVMPAQLSAARLLDRYSMEMTAKDIARLQEARLMIDAGTQISVTFLPGEEQAARIDAARTVHSCGFKAMPHLSARRLASETELRASTALRDVAALDRVFVVAGDPPQAAGPFHDARDLINSGILCEYGVKTVGIAGYPEGHPDILDTDLWSALREKLALLNGLGMETEIITQFAFDAEPVLDWIAKVRGEGIDAPIRIGIPGPVNVKTLMKFAARCGVGTSAKVVAKYGLSITKLLTTATPDAFVNELALHIDPAVHGPVRLHLYPFGGLLKTAEWARAAKASVRTVRAEAAG